MEFITENNRIFLPDESGDMLAEITFSKVDENTISIDRTFVDDTLRGQGIAGKLMEALLQMLQQKRWKAVSLCSYAIHWFQKHPEHASLLSEE